MIKTLRIISLRNLLFTIAFLSLNNIALFAQSENKAYPSLLWEVTGNGLKKPSYLFGTMHISNKMAFRLSDSFYQAIENVDLVAIELNPENWQKDIATYDKNNLNYQLYNATYYPDYLKSSSFKQNGFIEQLQASMQQEPALNNMLLYRQDAGMENFQEDTYLDLYIYQTGKKLGKATAGVETYGRAQQLSVEAYIDMAKEKLRNNTFFNQEDGNSSQLGQLLQDAYKKGDLDLLDSLNSSSTNSDAYMEKFLYLRNEIQANSMIELMQNQSVFVGVGAAHLPGKRGIIEILRKKGYTLRPVFMHEHAVSRKDVIDSIKVPVTFQKVYAQDSSFSFKVPGEINHIDNLTMNYADMANGSYYVINRIPTNIFFTNYNTDKSLRLIDSLLYENIPGRIIEKKKITKGNLEGLNIVNRTVRGDWQQYQFWITPHEIIVFKMGGKGNYVQGEEAKTFFESIHFDEDAKLQQTTTALSKESFSVQLPAPPYRFYKDRDDDNLPVWTYSSVNAAQQEYFYIRKKSIYTFNFLDEDTFNLHLIVKSFAENELIKKSIRQQYGTTQEGIPYLDISYTTKYNDYVHARAIIFGAQYYLLAVRSSNKQNAYSQFFNSFQYKPAYYSPGKLYIDSFNKFQVVTPIAPVLTDDLYDLVKYAKDNEDTLKRFRGITYTEVPLRTFCNYISEESGEVIIVKKFEMPKYFWCKDTLKMLQDVLEYDSSMHFKVVQKGIQNGDLSWLIHLTDTGTKSVIQVKALLRGMNLLTATTTIHPQFNPSDFVKNFFETLNFYQVESFPSVFENKKEQWIKDCQNQDSLIFQPAFIASRFITLDSLSLQDMQTLLKAIPKQHKQYTVYKSSIIELYGKTNYKSKNPKILSHLNDIYVASGDTLKFQQAVLLALKNIQTDTAHKLYKTLLLQDPPAFDEMSAYEQLIYTPDSLLKYTQSYFPELLNLFMIGDYRMSVLELLQKATDSSIVKPEVYEDYVGNFLFNAKIIFKKQQYSSETTPKSTSRLFSSYSKSKKKFEFAGREMTLYFNLLSKYYHKNTNIPKFYQQVLNSPNNGMKLALVTSLLKQNEPIQDSVWKDLLQDPKDYYPIYISLVLQKLNDKLPKFIFDEDKLSRSELEHLSKSDIDTLTFIKSFKTSWKGEPSTVRVYEIKYQNSNTSDSYIALTLFNQQGKTKYYDDAYAFIAKDAFSKSKNKEEQIADFFEKLKIESRNSGKYFYASDES